MGSGVYNSSNEDSLLKSSNSYGQSTASNLFVGVRQPTVFEPSKSVTVGEVRIYGSLVTPLDSTNAETRESDDQEAGT